MIDFEQHPAATEMLALFQAQVDTLFAARGGLNTGLVTDVQQLVEQWTIKCHREGIDFPRFAYIVLPSVNTLALLRKDMGRKALETRIVNLCVAHPRLDMVELAVGIKREFPWYKPEGLKVPRERHSRVFDA